MNKIIDELLELRAEFLAEAAESMAELDVDLVTLEKGPPKPYYKELHDG